MSTADFPGVRWRGHWVAPDVPEFVIDPTSVGSDLPPAEFSRAQFRRVFDVGEVPARVPLRLSADSRGAGLSLTAWQAMLVVNLSWTAHGINIGQIPMILTSALSLGATVPILYLMARELRLHLLPVLLPGLLGARALISVDQVFGSPAYGTVAIIPAVVFNAGQSIELVRSPRIVGVSVLFLILAVVNQGLWLSWAILVPDIGTVIVAAVTGTITVFNLIWWSLRILGLRPLPAAAAGNFDRGRRRHRRQCQSPPAAERRGRLPIHGHPAGDQGPPPSLTQPTTASR